MDTINVTKETKKEFRKEKLIESAKKGETISEENFVRFLIKKYKEVKNE